MVILKKFLSSFFYSSIMTDVWFYNKLNKDNVIFIVDKNGVI